MKLNKLKKLGLPKNTMLTLSYSVGEDIVHYTGEDFEGEVVRKSDIFGTVASLISQKKLSNNSFLNNLRNMDLLEDYSRGDSTFKEYIAGTLNESWRDCMLFDVETEHYDHKRGFTKVTANVKVTIGDVLKLTDSDLVAWNMKINLDD